MNAVGAFVERCRRRLLAQQINADLSIALLLSLVVGVMIALARNDHVLGMLAGIAGAAVVAGVVATVMRAPRASDAAVAIERRTRCDNLIITATEIAARPDRTRPYVAQMISTRAGELVGRLDAETLFPIAPGGVRLSALVAAWAMLLVYAGARQSESLRPLIPPALRGATAGANDISILISPPAYSGLKPQRLTNPTRVEALAGSLIEIETERAATIQTVAGLLSARDSTGRSFATTADVDGFLAISTQDERRLIGLVVNPDRSPRVRVSAPGKDMFLADAKRSIPVTVEADDDFALATLVLRYTKVSGSGERFTFEEGTIPVALTRTDDRDWKATATLALEPMKLEPGDMIVYRGAATDRRPGVAPTESDAFIVEITTPLSIAAEGFSLDDQQDKYALSQQMVILHTERLIARMPGMSPESLAYHSQMIAAEQRSVRAEFVFMMGGEVAEEVIAAAGMDINEEHEAANEEEIAAGRMVNRGRVALVQAIRLMSRANTILSRGDPVAALPEEKKALVSLQEAFTRTRYLLRALTQRERLDLSRRLTGVLELAARDARPQPAPPENQRTIVLRQSMAKLASLASGQTLNRTALSEIGQQILQLGPSDERLQGIANRIANATNAGDVEAAVIALASTLRDGVSPASAAVESPALRRLRSALRDAGGQR